jgi:ABC-type transport system involved in multi-copper enzyme maturation permease subunit
VPDNPLAFGKHMPGTLETEVPEVAVEVKPPVPALAPHGPSHRLGTLVMKEVHDLVLTLRFTLGTALVLILAVLAAYIGSLDYNARLDSYNTKVKLNQDNLSQVAVYSYFKPTLVRPPEPLSVLDHGLEGRLGTDVNIGVDEDQTEATGENRGNEYLAIFSEVDLTIIVGVILGLLALLFTFDAVSGEREAGTLKLMMSFSLPRSEFLLGKFLGAWVALMLPTALACVLSLMVMGAVAHVHFGGPEFIRIGLIFAAYAVYLSVLLLVGLVTSSFVRRSSIALVFSTFIWFLFVAVVPNMATMIPDFVGSRARVYDTANEQLLQIDKQMRDAARQVKDPRNFDGKKEPMALYHYAINNSNDGWVGLECHFGDAQYYNGLSQYFGQAIPLVMKFAARRADVWREYLRYRTRQATWARELAFLSPTAVMENLAQFLSGTSSVDYRHFMDLAAQYRNTFIAYLQSRNAFTSWRWFTTDPEDGNPPWTILATGKTPDEMAATGRNPMEVLNAWSKDKDSWATFIKMEMDRDKDTSRYLSLRGLPAFAYTRLETSAILVQAAPEIGCLLLLNLILFLVVYVRFIRYDVR